MTDPTPRPPLTVEEYLAFENASPERHEYVAGDVFAMSGASLRHNRIVGNIVHRLWNAAHDGRCDVHFEGVKLRVASDVIYYPDVMVLCGAQDDELVAREPCLVVEVTSPSTAATDRREKLTNYRRIASLRAYLIIDQRRRRVDHHWRDDTGTWWQAALVGGGGIPLPCPAIVLTLDEIYAGVTMVVGEPEPADDEYDDAYADDVG
jgi:Uma2 family endonuclease